MLWWKQSEWATSQHCHKPSITTLEGTMVMTRNKVWRFLVTFVSKFTLFITLTFFFTSFLFVLIKELGFFYCVWMKWVIEEKRVNAKDLRRVCAGEWVSNWTSHRYPLNCWIPSYDQRLVRVHKIHSTFLSQTFLFLSIFCAFPHFASFKITTPP